MLGRVLIEGHFEHRLVVEPSAPMVMPALDPQIFTFDRGRAHC